jgi:hypothetical protein
VCTHIADIDYQTIITYTGGYDDMVMAKTQIRSRIESENVQREKKIAQLMDFIQRFGAGTRAAQTTSRRKEVERLETTALARSNIQRPYIRFTQNRPAGKVAMEIKGISKAFGDLQVIDDFSAIVNRGEKIRAGRTQRRRQDHHAEGADGRQPELPAVARRPRCGLRALGARGVDRLFSPGPHGAIEKGLTAVEWLHRFDPDAHRQDIHGCLVRCSSPAKKG